MSLIFLFLLVDFHVSQLVFEPCHLLLKDETFDTVSCYETCLGEETSDLA